MRCLGEKYIIFVSKTEEVVNNMSCREGVGEVITSSVIYCSRRRQSSKMKQWILIHPVVLDNKVLLDSSDVCHSLF